MKLSTRGRYALRMMIEIAKQPDDCPVSLKVVSEQTEISRRYLDQLAAVLKGVRLLRPHIGKGGGYQLGRPANEISLGDIVEAAIGPINIVDCVQEPETCQRSTDCSCRSVYGLINSRIRQVFSSISLAEMVDQEGFEQAVSMLTVPSPSPCHKDSEGLD